MNSNSESKFDYDTVEQAEREIGSMFDLDTKEGQRQFEGLMRLARIRERDDE